MRKEIQDASLKMLRSGEKTLAEIETALVEEYPNASAETVARWIKSLSDKLAKDGVNPDVLAADRRAMVEQARSLTGALAANDDLVTLDADGSKAWREFEAAAKMLRDVELTRRTAVERYNAALAGLSRVAAPDPNAAR